MTRKRFKKLLMSYGKQRNEAEVTAFLYNSSNLPYEEAYKDFMRKYSFRKACARISDSFSNFAKSANKICAAIAALKLALINQREIMEREAALEAEKL